MKALYNIPKEELEELVKSSLTYSEVMRKLGYTNNRGNSYIGLKNKISDYRIDVTHLKGKGHGTSKNELYKLEDVLIKNSTYTNTTSLKRRILKNKLIEYKCENCGIIEWNNKPIVLQLDHINGNNRDNRIENLRLLCPNCHSQTETFCRRS